MDFDSIIECSIHSGGTKIKKETTMPVDTLYRALRKCGISITQDLVRGCEIITTRYDDGTVHTSTRGLLHGPWPPPVYRLSLYSEGEDCCLPTITSEKWHTHTKWFEIHPWIVKHRVEDSMVLVINRNGWVADKESLRPQLQRALRTWHTKLTAYLADAEEALADAMFKPL